MASKRIALAGAGNVATALGVALSSAGVAPVAVWSRTLRSAEILSERIGCPACETLSELPAPDVIIVSVADSAIKDVAADAAAAFPDALILHTAGSVPMDILREAGAQKYGVLYPMQTFSRQREADFTPVTVFVEGCDKACEERAADIARLLGGKVQQATSEQRKYLHIAAVFACNFANAAYTMASELLEEHNMPFEAMLPLIDETAAKVHRLHPLDAQTGPAHRGDCVVTDAHKAMLDGRLKSLYTEISDYIADAKRRKSDKEKETK